MKKWQIAFFIVFSINAFLLFPVNHSKAAETLIIPSYGTPTVMSSPLMSGVPYIIEVSGIFEYNPATGRYSDAEWMQREIPYQPDWVENINHPDYPDILDLLINEVAYNWMGTTDAVNFSPHTYSPNHIYRLEWLGMGEALAFRIEDATGYTQYDNIGLLEVVIEPIPAPGAILLGVIGTGFVGWLRRRRVI
jgi:hypothetical protein